MKTQPRRSYLARHHQEIDFNNLPVALTPAEAALVLRISADSYYRHIHPQVAVGAIKSYKIGRKRLLLTRSLLEWQERQSEASLV